MSGTAVNDKPSYLYAKDFCKVLFKTDFFSLWDLKIVRFIVVPNNVYDDLIYPHHTILPGDEIPKRKKKVKKYLPIKIEELESYVSSQQENDREEMRKEYRVSGIGVIK